MTRSAAGTGRGGTVPVLVGAVCGLAWAASLRAFMAEFAGSESTFHWFGTYEGILLPGAVVGGLLGWSEHLQRSGGGPGGGSRRRRWCSFWPPRES